jgi:DNA-binding transcriptional MerR regulator
MNELTEATGLPKSAILHYITQGLLPDPVKTGPNMAYYDPACIERIKFIKDMQSKYSFPLNKIKVLLAWRDQGRDLTPLIELDEIVFDSGEPHSLDEAAFCTATGLTATQVKELVKNDLLLPLSKGIFKSHDVAVGNIYAQGLSAGMKIADFTFYTKFAKQIVDNEMKLWQRVTSHVPEEELALLTKGMVQASRVLRNYIIDRIFQKRIALAGDLKDIGIM